MEGSGPRMYSPAEVYTTDELAAVLRMHPETVRRLLREGRIAGFKLSRHWRVTHETMNAAAAGALL